MINARIKHVRKEIAKMTLEQFGEKIGISASACSYIEKGINNPSDQTIRSICREFGIREAWLRTGEEPMYTLPKDETAAYVGQLLRDVENPLYDVIKAIMQTYSELDGNSQAVIRETVKKFRDNLKKEAGD